LRGRREIAHRVLGRVGVLRDPLHDAEALTGSIVDLDDGGRHGPGALGHGFDALAAGAPAALGARGFLLGALRQGLRGTGRVQHRARRLLHGAAHLGHCLQKLGGGALDHALALVDGLAREPLVQRDRGDHVHEQQTDHGTAAVDGGLGRERMQAEDLVEQELAKPQARRGAHARADPRGHLGRDRGLDRFFVGRAEIPREQNIEMTGLVRDQRRLVRLDPLGLLGEAFDEAGAVGVDDIADVPIDDRPQATGDAQHVVVDPAHGQSLRDFLRERFVHLVGHEP